MQSANIIGTRIKNRRKALGLTQLDIKAATGISSGNISEIENGNRLPAASTLVHLARTLECTIDWILTGDVSVPATPRDVFSDCEDSAERTLLQGFRQLSEEDREELLAIVQIKLQKSKKREPASLKSSPSPDAVDNNLAG